MRPLSVGSVGRANLSSVENAVGADHVDLGRALLLGRCGSLLLLLVITIKDGCAKLLAKSTANRLLRLLCLLRLDGLIEAASRARSLLLLGLLQAHDGLADFLLGRENFPEVVNRKLVVFLPSCSLIATCRAHHHLAKCYILLL